MPNAGLIQESKALLSSWLKSLEVRRAGGDVQKLQLIAAATDDEIVKKWLWTATIYGVPLCYIAVPVTLLLLGIVFTPFILEILWFFAKIAMAIVFVIFGLAIFVTFIGPKNAS
jgi:hypothetical protein